MNSQRLQSPLSDESYIDFHTHILPRMDDGSDSVEMSLKMLEDSVGQDIGCIVLTPHFYALSDYPEHFLSKRSKRFDLLKASMQADAPRLILAAEVQYFEGITTMAELSQMRIGDSSGILIEMPFCKWTERMLNDILEINNRAGYQVVLAHIERYLPFVEISTIRSLVEKGVWMQANASFFSGFLRSRKAIRMLKDGLIHLIGSDCHNLSSRAQNLQKACLTIKRNCGQEALNQLTWRGLYLIGQQLSEENEAAKELTV